MYVKGIFFLLTLTTLAQCKYTYDTFRNLFSYMYSVIMGRLLLIERQPLNTVMHTHTHKPGEESCYTSASFFLCLCCLCLNPLNLHDNEYTLFMIALQKPIDGTSAILGHKM